MENLKDAPHRSDTGNGVSAPSSGGAARRTLEHHAEAIAQRVIARHYPEGARSEREEYDRGRCLQDIRFHLDYLAQAVDAREPALFSDYVAWAKVMLGERGISAEALARNLLVLREAACAELSDDAGRLAAEYLDAGLAALPAMRHDLPSFLQSGVPHAVLANDYLHALLGGERQRASRMILAAVEGGVHVRDIYLHVFQRSQQEIGRLWQMNRISVAQEHYATAATQLIMSQLYPHIFSTARNGRVMVATCIAGDLHEIGVRMVSDFFEIEGWDTFYLGANVPHASVLSTVSERRADVLAVSATITPHVGAVRTLIDVLRDDPRCRHVKVLVGGYPFNVAPELWRQVGADGCAGDAMGAVELASALVSGQ